MKNVYPKLVTDLMDRLEALKLFQLQVGFRNDYSQLLAKNNSKSFLSRSPIVHGNQSQLVIGKILDRQWRSLG